MEYQRSIRARLYSSFQLDYPDPLNGVFGEQDHSSLSDYKGV